MTSRKKPSLLLFSNRTDGGQDLLCKGDQQAAEQAQKTLCSLAGIVGLDGHTHLHNAPAEDDDAQRLDDAENEVREVVDDGQRVATRRKCGVARAQSISTAAAPVQ